MKMDDYTAKKFIPHYGAIRAGIRQASRGTRGGSGKGKKKAERLTEISQGSGKPVLRQGVGVSRAAKKLYGYEETGLTPAQIISLQERERNLTEKLKKMQDW